MSLDWSYEMTVKMSWFFLTQFIWKPFLPGLSKLINSLPNDKILSLSKSKELADEKVNVKKLIKHCGKRAKCWLQKKLKPLLEK